MIYATDLFYSSTNDIIKTIGLIVVRIESEGWISEDAEWFITEGGQRNILGNNLLPSLGFEVRQKRVSGGVNDVARCHKTRGKLSTRPFNISLSNVF